MCFSLKTESVYDQMLKLCFTARGTQVHSANYTCDFRPARVLALTNQQFFLRIRHTLEYTSTLNMKRVKVDRAKPQNLAALLISLTHTCTLTIQPLFWKYHFLCFCRGFPLACVCPCVCVFFLGSDYSRAFPYLVFPKNSVDCRVAL